MADKAGYASPMLLETGGRRLIVGCSARHFFCVDAETGKLAWKQTVPAKFEVIGSIPVIFGNRVFFVAPGEYGGECFRAYADAENVRFESLWRTDVDSCHGALLHVDGKLYGSGYRRFKPWVCLDGKTGRMLYSKEDIAIGSCLFAEGRLYALEQEGRMFLLEPTDTAFAVRGEFQFVERPKRRDVWAHPVVYDGKLYLRYYDTLHCFDVRRKE